MWNHNRHTTSERLLLDIIEGVEWVVSAQDDIDAAVAALNDLTATVSDGVSKLNEDVSTLQGLEKVDTSALNDAVSKANDAGTSLDGAVAGVGGLVPAAPAEEAPAPSDGTAAPADGTDVNGQETAPGSGFDANGNPVAV